MGGLERVRHPGLRIPSGGLNYGTLSFIPRLHGYSVGMNRDELRSRFRAFAPRYLERNGVTAVYPSETLGGTWIAVNACLWPVVCSPELVLCLRSYVYGNPAVARRDNPADDFRLRFTCRCRGLRLT